MKKRIKRAVSILAAVGMLVGGMPDTVSAASPVEGKAVAKTGTVAKQETGATSVTCTDAASLKEALDNDTVKNITINFSETCVLTSDDLGPNGYFFDIESDKTIETSSNISFNVQTKKGDYKGIFRAYGKGVNVTLKRGTISAYFKERETDNADGLKQNYIFAVDGGATVHQMDFKIVWDKDASKNAGAYVYPVMVGNGTFNVNDGALLKGLAYGTCSEFFPVQAAGVINVCSEKANVNIYPGSTIVAEYDGGHNGKFLPLPGQCVYIGSGIRLLEGYDFEAGYKRCHIYGGDFVSSWSRVDGKTSEVAACNPVEKYMEPGRRILYPANTDISFAQLNWRVATVITQPSNMSYNESKQCWEIFTSGKEEMTFHTFRYDNDVKFVDPTTYETGNYPVNYPGEPKSIIWEYSYDGTKWFEATVENGVLVSKEDYDCTIHPAAKPGKDVYYRVKRSANPSWQLDELTETVLVHYLDTMVSAQVGVTYADGIRYATEENPATLNLSQWEGLAYGETIPDTTSTRLYVNKKPEGSRMYDSTYLGSTSKTSFQFPKDFAGYQRATSGTYQVSIAKCTSAGRWVCSDPVTVEYKIPAKELSFSYDKKRFFQCEGESQKAYHAAGLGPLSISAEILPNGYSPELCEGVTWSSSDSTVVRVKVDGTLEAVKPGKATLKATCGIGSKSIDVVVPVTRLQVSDLTLPSYGDESFDTNVKVTTDSDKEVTTNVKWKCYDRNTVDEKPVVGCRYECSVTMTLTGDQEVPKVLSGDSPVPTYGDMSVGINGEVEKVNLGVTGYQGCYLSEDGKTVTLRYLTDEIVNPDAKEISTVYVDYDTNLIHGMKKSEWEDSIRIRCAGPANEVLKLSDHMLQDNNPTMYAVSNNPYIMGGESYKTFVCVKIENKIDGEYKFADTLTVIINGKETTSIKGESSFGTDTFCPVACEILTAEGEPSFSRITSFIPKTIHLKVGETLNVEDYFEVYPKENDAVFKYGNYSDYWNENYTVNNETKKIKGVAVTDGAYKMTVTATYTETSEDGVERTYKEKYNIPVHVYAEDATVPTAYNVKLDGKDYTTARAGETVYIGNSSDTQLLKAVSKDGTNLPKQDNSFSSGYGCYYFTMPESDVELTGTWEKIPVYHKVQFIMNGYGTPILSRKVKEGDLIEQPTAPTAEESASVAFVGWYKDAAFTQAWNFAEDTVTSNVVLYACWQHEHDYEAATWFMDDKNHWKECKSCGEKKDVAAHVPGPEATLTDPQVCTECGYIIALELGHTHKISKVLGKTPTCEEDGWSDYYRCQTCAKMYSDADLTKEITNLSEWKAGAGKREALGHEYGEPVFWWDSDTEVTATFTCKRDEFHVVVKECVVSSEITKEPSGSMKGEKTYTAIVTFNGNTYTDKNVEAYGGTEEEPTSTPDPTGSSTPGEHGGSEEASTPTPVPTGSSTPGEYGGTEGEPTPDPSGSSTPEEEHEYGEPSFWWNSYTDVTATFVCQKDSSHQEVLNCEVTSEITTLPTTEAKGERTYTATITFNGKTYTDVVTEEIEKLTPGSQMWTPEPGETSGSQMPTQGPGATSVATPVVTAAPNPTEAPILLPPVGETVVDPSSKGYYQVSKADATAGMVTYICNEKESASKVIIPATITINGVTYKVTKIANNAFANNTKLQTVVIGSNVTSIGSKAFFKCKNLKKVTIETTKLKSIAKNAFKGAGSSAYKKLVVKVPKKRLGTYKKLLKKGGLSPKAKVK